MYVGRIIIVGRTEGRSWAAYRVSSRSFPNRKAEVKGKSIFISPLDPNDQAKSPYIAYNCIRAVDDAAVVANGTQAEMIADKIEDGMRPLDAIALSLLALGYERDELSTPRLAGAVRGEKAWLGAAMKGEFRVKEVSLKDGDAFMATTYGRTGFESVVMSGKDAAEIAMEAFQMPFERPVCSAAAFKVEEGFELAVYNPA